MWALAVAKGQVRIDKVPKMVFAEHDEMIKAFDLERLKPAFAEGVHIRRPDTGTHYFDVLGL
jgi:hypothetical protein